KNNTISQLHLIQNSAARVLTRRTAHITLILKSLHWLLEPVRPLRSSGALLLTVPKSRTKTFGDAAFSCYAPSSCNSLPEDLRRAENIDIFKCRL
ncbi:hypothetical protein LDENG_00152670, partial [Lucifuga dentata]